MTADEIKSLIEEADSFEYPTVTRELADQATDVIRSLAAALRELTTLRKMAEAPKDGTPVLIICQDMFPQVMHWEESTHGAAGWRLSGGAPTGGFHSGHWFDGWLPLPPAPEVPR